MRDGGVLSRSALRIAGPWRLEGGTRRPARRPGLSRAAGPVPPQQSAPPQQSGSAPLESHGPWLPDGGPGVVHPTCPLVGDTFSLLSALPSLSLSVMPSLSLSVMPSLSHSVGDAFSHSSLSPAMLRSAMPVRLPSLSVAPIAERPADQASSGHRRRRPEADQASTVRADAPPEYGAAACSRLTPWCPPTRPL